MAFLDKTGLEHLWAHIVSKINDSKIIVDDALSSTSMNPVQNKVINATISNLSQLVDDTVSASDIVDNLTTNASGKVLSAAQGVALKAMIDGIVIPTTLPNPQPITINGQRYDGSEAVTVTTVEIDDTLTQSGKAADAKAVGDRLTALNAAIDAKGDPTDEQVSAAVNAYLDANPVSGGISTTAKNLLITILRSGVYTDDQSANITSLETALGGGATEPEEKTYAISNELINCTSSNSATSVNENASYSTTLTANDGYTLTGGTVTVTMGGVDITATAYADGVISIGAVTGNVEIFASAVAAQAEAVLPEDGLVAYFDLRSLDANTVNAGNTVGTAYGIPTATRGSASLYSWGAWVESSDEIGTTLKRSMMIGAENTADTFAVGTEYTAIGFTFDGYGNCFGHATNGNGWSVQAKYVTSGSTSTVPKEMISGSVVSTNKGYLACGYRVSGETIDFFADGEKVKTYVGSDYDNFVRWYDTTDNFSVAPYRSSGKIVAYVLYNRALTDVEIVEVRDFLRTLEVTA